MTKRMSRAFTIKGDAVARPLTVAETAKKYGLSAAEAVAVRDLVRAELTPPSDRSDRRKTKASKGRASLRLVHRKKASRRK